MSLKRFLLVRFGRADLVPDPPAAAAVRGGVLDPEAVQTRASPRHPPQQHDTAFGRDHKFSTHSHRRRLPQATSRSPPTSTSRRTSSACRRARRTRCSPIRRVLMFALTSGTTASRKLIPVTDEYLARLQARLEHVGPEDVPRQPRAQGRLRPIVQMVGDPEEFRTEAGIPCGNLSGYTAMVQKRIIRGCTRAVRHRQDQGRQGPVLRRPAVLDRRERVAVHGRQPEHAGAAGPHARRRERTR